MNYEFCCQYLQKHFQAAQYGTAHSYSLCFANIQNNFQYAKVKTSFLS